MTVRTRFAPSPTGYLHIGGVRTALFNWAFARRHGGQFILRIDDTDAQREVEGAVKLICDGFRWMGMDWDEGPEVGGPHGPYFQSQRGPKYEAAMEKLIEAGAAYPCYATDKELAAARDLAKAAKQPYIHRGKEREMPASEVMDAWKSKRPAMRFKVPLGQVVKLTDHVRGDVEWQTDLAGDFTIARAGGHPLYNFASIVDDVDMDITHVIRAEEHLSNTLPQLLILEALGGKRPEFAHVPFVAKPGGKQKLSKRDPPPGVMVALSEYEEAGYLPDAIFNGLARLGWSLDDKSEIIPRDKIVANFSLDRITKAAAALDMAKMYWIQDQYMQALPIDERTDKMLGILKKAGLVQSEPTPDQRAKLKALVGASGDRLKLMKDVIRYADYLFRDEFLLEPKAAKTLQAADAKAQLEQLRSAFAGLEPFDHANIERAAKEVGASLGVGGKINHVLRAAATGRTVGAGVYEVLEIMGKEQTLKNFDLTLECIQTGEFPPLVE
jgi:nondiscriminating glutamyl-tRNA synthetase